MFFLLSKIFSFLFSPLSWIFILLIIAFFLKNRQKKKITIYIAAAVLYLFSNNYLYFLAATGWNIKPISLKNSEHYKYAIVLGGMANFDKEVERIKFSEAADRLFQTISLYKTGHIDKFIIVGGSGSILYPETIESEIVRTYLLQIGIPESDILIENKSKNTHENALFTAKLLKRQNYRDSCLLVTSSFHIRRAKACFAKAGIKVKAYPTNQLDADFKFLPAAFLMPDASILSNWQLLIHEMLGYIVYWFKGYL
jgi:uncharacterized SAM-binding protein YcdF (DUF218 family)